MLFPKAHHETESFWICDTLAVRRKLSRSWLVTFKRTKINIMSVHRHDIRCMFSISSNWCGLQMPQTIYGSIILYQNLKHLHQGFRIFEWRVCGFHKVVEAHSSEEGTRGPSPEEKYNFRCERMHYEEYLGYELGLHASLC